MRIDLKHTLLFLRQDGVVQMNSTDHNYTKADIAEIIEAQGKISGGKRMPFLVVVSSFSDIENEARMYFATEEGTQYSSAEAFVITSIAQKLLANFYIKVDKPKVPARFFSDIKSAEQWLHSLK